MAKDRHTVCLSAYHNEANATETIDLLLEIYQDGWIKTPEEILTPIESGRAQEYDSAFARDRAERWPDSC
jgi:hypothetical protein